jgi:cytochrome oxidase Cu insertion factor (SCO1/SenC/PrrC family)/thiol-disulfide isomerase/thioredoxin
VYRAPADARQRKRIGGRMHPMRRWMRRCAVVLAAVIVTVGATTAAAHADGDPGSDVLVFQDLFVAADAGVPVAQQAQLGNLLQEAARSGFPVRVAIIAAQSDLGAVTALWRQPQAYARFLGIELSLAYKQRLLVVMPNGFGLNWPGHSTAADNRVLAGITIGAGGTGLLAAADTAVHSLAAANGVKLGPSAGPAGGSPGAGAGSGAAAQTPAPAAAGSATAAPAATAPFPSLTGPARATTTGQSTDTSVAAITLGVAAVVALFFAARYTVRRRRRGRLEADGTPPAAEPGPAAHRRGWALGRRQFVPGVALLFGVAAVAPIVVAAALTRSGTAQPSALQTNPYLDPGSRLSGPAPGFTLDDQFGRPVSLRSYRGKVVILAFTDSECTTICPMTTTAMLDAKAMLGPAASKVQLLGVDANPASTSLEDVASYSQLHGMTHAWEFVTGSLARLRRVWKDYAVEADIQRGLIAHTPALFVIGPDGHEAKVYMTQQSYAAVGQFGQILAREASSLLPGHPEVRSDLSYAPVPAIGPGMTVAVPRPGGGTVRLGPGRSARLYVFFATWDQEITSLAGHLDGLNRYQSSASGSGLPPLTAVDEGSVEPSDQALPAFMRTLPERLSYPVGIDSSGRIADGYQVLGEPWFVLTSPTGRILWYWQVSTSGWPSRSALIRDVRAAMARAPASPTGAAAVARDLAGSPAPLAQIHQQAGRLLGTQSALAARIRALKGYPIVVNAWASWCTPCRSEFGLFAEASASYGRRVAFLGADTNDSAGDAQAFLAQHRVSYPSYETNTSDLGSLAAIEGLPTTIFISPTGKVVYVHDGQYDSQGALDGDIATYALG